MKTTYLSHCGTCGHHFLHVPTRCAACGSRYIVRKKGN